MTSVKITQGEATPVRVVNIETTEDMRNRPVQKGAAIPVYITNYDADTPLDYDSIRVGDISGGNYTEIGEDGTMQAYGDATCWRDELLTITAAKLTSPSGDFEYDEAEIAVEAKISARYPTDFLSTNHQLNHDWALGTSIRCHIHWWQTTENVPNWLLAYRWQKQGAAKTTDWTLLPWATNAFTWTAGTLNQITSFPGIEPPVGYGEVSDIVQIKIFRDYTNVSTEFGDTDPVNASQYIVQFDPHINVDMLGSSMEYAK